MRRLWLLCPVKTFNKLTILSGKVQDLSEVLVAYIEKQQNLALKELEHKVRGDKE